MSAHINDLLQQFTHSIGITDFALDAQGYACLQIDELRINLEHVEHTDTLLLYAVMGTLPPAPNAALYAQLLEANFFFNGTGGATLGLDKDAGMVVLTQALDCTGKTLEMFERCLDSFVNAAQQWSQTLTIAHLNQGTSATETTADKASATQTADADLSNASWIRG